MKLFTSKIKTINYLRLLNVIKRNFKKSNKSKNEAL